MRLSVLAASGLLVQFAAAIVAPRNLVPRKEELCMIPITDCDSKCQGGSWHLNCAASYVCSLKRP